MGPGLGNTDAVAAIVRALVTTIQLPMVIDADALNALARDPQVLTQANQARLFLRRTPVKWPV